MEAAIGVGARVHPGAEHGADGTPKLRGRLLREGSAGLVVDHVLVAFHHVAPVLRGERGVLGDAARLDLGLLDDLLEPMVIDPEHDGAVHLDEAAIAVPCEALVAGRLGEALHGTVVEAKVEHRVHHAGHRHAGARPDGNQQRPLGVAEAEADRVFNQGQGSANLVIELPPGNGGRSRRTRCKPPW